MPFFLAGAREELSFLNVWGLWPQTDSLCNWWPRPARWPVGPRRGSRPSIVTPGLGGHTQRSLCVRFVTNRLMYSIKNHTPNVNYVWGKWEREIVCVCERESRGREKLERESEPESSREEEFGHFAILQKLQNAHYLEKLGILQLLQLL